ncbi:hypothetical protein ACTHS0_11975, partial [Neisseria sp. P0013.S009]|uniref:hypothetical protein n=1 Tax=Neisseria sp. P0013.S009 TaxID=3436745 RepID=UPI003F7ED077
MFSVGGVLGGGFVWGGVGVVFGGWGVVWVGGGCLELWLVLDGFCYLFCVLVVFCFRLFFVAVVFVVMLVVGCFWVVWGGVVGVV